MNKTFRQTFKEEDHLAHNVAIRWGYQIRSISLTQRKQFKHIPPLITKMKVYKQANGFTKTQKILQIQEEIQQLQNQKKINKMIHKGQMQNGSQQFAKSQKSEIIRLMEQKIGEYNYIVQHQHLAERQSDQTRKVLKIGQKSAAYKVLQRIQKENSHFKHEDLSSEIEHNRQMTTLYKEYHDKLSAVFKRKMVCNTILSEPPSSYLTTRDGREPYIKYTYEPIHNEQKKVGKQKNTRSDKSFTIGPLKEKPLQDAQQQFQQSFGRNNILKNNLKKQLTQPDQQTAHTKVHPKTQRNLHFYRETSKKQKDQARQILQPFLNKQQFKLYHTIQKKNLNNKQVLQLYKFRINEYRANFAQSHTKRPRKSNKKHQLMADQGQGMTTRQFNTEQSIKYNNNRSKSMMVQDIYHYHRQEANQINEKEKEKEQNKFENSLLKAEKEIQHYKFHQQENQDILAHILKKKLNKIELSLQKIKRSEIKGPKSLLQGETKRLNLDFKHHQDSKFVSKSPKSNNLKSSNISEEYNEIAGQLDDNFYQSLYRNEKFNLLTKKGYKK